MGSSVKICRKFISGMYVRQSLSHPCVFSKSALFLIRRIFHFPISNLLNRFLVKVMCGVLFVLPLSCAVTLYINESQRRISRQDMNFSSRLFEIYVNLSLERRPRAGRRNIMFYIPANHKNLHICTCWTHRVSIYTFRVISRSDYIYISWISCRKELQARDKCSRLCVQELKKKIKFHKMSSHFHAVFVPTKTRVLRQDMIFFSPLKKFCIYSCDVIMTSLPLFSLNTSAQTSQPYYMLAEMDSTPVLE